MIICSNCKIEKLNTDFYSKHRQCKACFKLKYYDSKRESLQLYWAEHFQKNKERKQEYSKIYKRNNREKTRRYARNTYAKDPQKALSKGYLRRSKMKGNFITKEAWKERLEEFNYCCAYCLSPTTPLEMEHMHPISKGGSHTIENLIPVCGSCNKLKHNKTLVQFAQSGALHLY